MPPIATRATPEFLPKLVTVLREGYSPHDLRADALAGLTVAIVALPLSMAIAIASGVGPERGLYTTIIGGFLVSALGGSRHQIGGPAGAFIVLVSACVMAIGIQGLVLATFLSGFLMVLAGGLRLGTYIKFIPHPVTVGFTTGIAVIIFASQIKDLLGLTLEGPEPGEIFGKLSALWDARESVTPAAFAVAGAVVAIILGLKRYLPGWPNMLIAVALASAGVALTGAGVETIATRFGALPRGLPMPALPDLDLATLTAALPFALSFTLLGSIESLLSAVVADGMTGRRHRSNAELMAQGVANIGSSLFGGFCVTGTIARTATNVRAGSRGPVSGMLHALFVLLFLLVAAPLAGFIPLAALAGVLTVVAWTMAEREEFRALLRSSRGDALVVTITFLLVVFRDLTTGIVVGFALGGLVFIRHMSEATAIEPAAEEPFPEGVASDAHCVTYRLRGPYFFGAAARLGAVLDQISDRPSNFVIDMADVPFIDSSGTHAIALLGRKLARKGGQLYVTAARPEVRRALALGGATEPDVRFVEDRREVAQSETQAPA